MIMPNDDILIRKQLLRSFLIMIPLPIVDRCKSPVIAICLSAMVADVVDNCPEAFTVNRHNPPLGAVKMIPPDDVLICKLPPLILVFETLTVALELTLKTPELFTFILCLMLLTSVNTMPSVALLIQISDGETTYGA